MNRKYKKIITAISIAYFFLAFGTTLAATDYVPLAPLPGISGHTTFSSYLPTAFNLSIGIAAAMAFVMITYGGIMYATSDAISGKSAGKDAIENALWGLLLVIGAYVILYTINPKILNFDLTLDRIKTPTTTPVPPVGTIDCPACQSYPNLSDLHIPAQVSGSVSPELGARLVVLNTDLNGISWAVTEAWPPVPGLHVDPCHANATCVDAKPVNQSPQNINAFYAAAQQANLNPSYEVTSQAAKDALLNGQPPVTIPISVNTKATGPHFHVKLQ